MIKEEYDMFSKPWKNPACLGYVITALENLNYEPEKIVEATMELSELFDWMTVEDAENAYIDSEYC